MCRAILYQIFIVIVCFSIEIDSVDYTIQYQKVEKHLIKSFNNNSELINCTMKHLIDSGVISQLSDRTLDEENKMIEGLQMYILYFRDTCKRYFMAKELFEVDHHVMMQHPSISTPPQSTGTTNSSKIIMLVIVKLLALKFYLIYRLYKSSQETENEVQV